MDRRDVSKLFLSAAGVAVPLELAAQTATPQRNTRTRFESDRALVPRDLAYEPNDLRRYGLVPDGTTDNTAQFRSLIASIGTAPIVLIVDGGDFLLGTMSVPANVVLQFRGNGRLRARASTTLTINGAIGAAERQNVFAGGPGAFAIGIGFQRQATPFWFGATGDFSADDTAAVQAAIDFAGDNGVLLVNGRFLCKGGLALKSWTRVVGLGFRLNNRDTVDGTMPALGTNLKTGNFLAAPGPASGHRNGPQFETVSIVNVTGTWLEETQRFSGNTCTALAIVDNVIMDRCKIEGFQRAITLDNAPYYSRLRSVEFLLCSVGIRALAAAYNLDLLDCKFNRVEYPVNSPWSAAITNLKVTGGSIENFCTAFDGLIELTVVGTYFETEVRGSFGMFSAQAADNVCVTLLGCTIYLNNMNRFVNFSGRQDVALYGHGNSWHADAPEAAGAIAYCLPSSGAVSISSDNVTPKWKARYTAGETPQFLIQFPNGVGHDGVVYTGQLSGGVPYEPPSLADGTGATAKVPVSGVVPGDLVEAISFSEDLEGLTVTGYVSESGTISVRFQNGTGRGVSLPRGTLRVRARKQ